MWGVFVMGVAAIFFSTVAMLSGLNSGFADGYCTALGGAKIDNTVCNVDGKVVEIP